MESSRDATTTMLEYAPVVAAKIAMIEDGHAAGNVGAVVKEHGAAIPGRRPCVKAPTVRRVDADWDSNGEGKSISHHDAGRRRQHDKAGVGDKQCSPNLPRIVIRNINHSRSHRHNFDQARFYNHTLLRGRH